MFLIDVRSDYSRQVIQRKLIEINDTISSLTSSRNKNIIDDQLKNIKNTDGTFNRIGMWKMRSKLFPNKLEHPTAKKDGAGNLITAVEPLKRL